MTNIGKSRLQNANAFHERYHDLLSKNQEEYTITQKDIDENPSLKRASPGDKIKRTKTPNNIPEAISLFRELYAMLHLYVEVDLFQTSFGVWNESSIREELDKLNSFIEKANKLSYLDACAWANQDMWRLGHYGDSGIPEREFIYLLWSKDGGSFFNDFEYYNQYCSQFSKHAEVYGKYILYKKYLEDRLTEVSPSEKGRSVGDNKVGNTTSAERKGKNGSNINGKSNNGNSGDTFESIGLTAENKAKLITALKRADILNEEGEWVPRTYLAIGEIFSFLEKYGFIKFGSKKSQKRINLICKKEFNCGVSENSVSHFGHKGRLPMKEEDKKELVRCLEEALLQ